MNVRWDPLLISEVRASRILFSSELATCWDGHRFCIRWSVDILSETMRTLWVEMSSCTSLRADRTDFSSVWKGEHYLPAGRVH